MTIRPADPQHDAAACAAIYAPYVESTVISFEDVPPGEAEFAHRIEKYAATHQFLVAESGGTVAGYAYACEWASRPAYRWSVETSVYVDSARRGAGVGRALYLELFDRLRAQGFQIAVAGVTLPNQASIRLHESLGFEPIGALREIGWKMGEWHDVGYWQLDLQPSRAGIPPEPRLPGSAA